MYSKAFPSLLDAFSQVGDKVLITTPQWKYGIYDPFLYIGTTYLFGIGGGCSRFKMWTPYSSFSREVIQIITNACKGCHFVNFGFRNYHPFINESTGTIEFELILINSISDYSIVIPEDITVQVGVSNDTINSATGRLALCILLMLIIKNLKLCRRRGFYFWTIQCHISSRIY